jgi:hypothetical protein
MSVMSFATPPFTSFEEFQRVMSTLGSEPEGQEARFVIEYEGGLRIVAVWQSRDHAERFQRERLGKALAEAIGEPSGRPEVLWYEVLESHVATTALTA